MEFKAKRHPSGRPIHTVQRGVTTYLRIPRDGYHTPGLRNRDLPDAIGFVTGWPYESGDETKIKE